MNSKELILIYENVAEITAQMLDAALEGDWQLLSRLEERCSMQVQAIKDDDTPVELARDEREKKVKVLQRILADDRKIRDITQPRLAQLSEMMRHSSTQNKLARAYKLDHRPSI